MSVLSRGRSPTNASLISITQRFSDILIMVVGIYLICLLHNQKFIYIHALLILGALVVFQMVGGITDFYRSWRGVKLSRELFLILQNWSLSLLLTVGTISLFRAVELPFRFYLSWYLLVSVGLVAARITIRFIAGMFRKRGYNIRYVAIAGNMPQGLALARSFIDQPWLGFKVAGIYGDAPDYDDTDIPYGGDFTSMLEDARSGRIDRVYLAMSMSEEQKIHELVDLLTDTTCAVMLIPDIFTFNILQSRSEEVNGVPMVSLIDTPLDGMNMVLKRLEDIILSTMILIFIAPVLITIACMVKMTSPGPVIFRQVRYGMDGKPIKVWKFRSMNVMENGDKVVQATRGDSRLTPIGGFLRRTSLDELPQFFNVLFGDMSIVGPRPHAVAHNEQYRNLIRGYMLRHKVKPGITGWAQVNGWRGETDTLDKMEKRIEYDLEYIRCWSIWLDLRIVFFTLFKGFVSKTAY
ncbi:undecaprenyl-phosphate glucose phosphotransferase [Paramixta manurensis]|uniref:Undecaprenyl-phosphate glucose phosphotransferase n=1 Tax=Paramixta manurensis TaxID=2740817 RepID=A0A6M8ULL4_9GAMM|nr:undecaprenyl-phosphate glucose phosphotransferase [Erwiniaceae bacterium PD-1]